MKTVLKLFLVVLMISCGRWIDKIERPHDYYHENIKALIVIKREGNTIYFRSPVGLSYYKLNDRFENYQHTDTFLLRDYPDLYYDVDILNDEPNNN